jgi:hypothetical protein
LSRIALIENFDERRVRETLDLLLRDRRNEFRELAEAIGIPQCMTIMREIAKGKKHIHEIIHLQDIAYTLQTEFHQTYKRVS